MHSPWLEKPENVAQPPSLHWSIVVGRTGGGGGGASHVTSPVETGPARRLNAGSVASRTTGSDCAGPPAKSKLKDPVASVRISSNWPAGAGPGLRLSKKKTTMFVFGSKPEPLIVREYPIGPDV